MLQDGFFDGVTEADIAFAAGSESHTGCEADIGFEEETFAETERIGKAVNTGKKIERAFGFGDGDALHGAESGEAEIAVFLEHCDELVHRRVAVIECGFPGFLNEGRGATDDELVELGGLLSEIRTGDKPAETPPGHAPGFGEALSDEHGVIARRELEDAGDDRAAVVDQPFIDFVGDKPEVVAAGEIE